MTIWRCPPAAGLHLSEHWADSTVLRGSLSWEKQLLPQGRPHLAVDIHLPVGEQVLHHLIVPLLGCQVQTRGALGILHTSTEQTLRAAQGQQRSSQMEQRTPKAPSPLPAGQRGGARVSTEQSLGALHQRGSTCAETEAQSAKGFAKPGEGTSPKPWQ